MVDYSRFDNIGVDSSSESDREMETSGFIASIHSARDSALGEQLSFSYPLGIKSATLAKFDIRDESCKPFGFSHGDVVITHQGIISTVIGVRRGDLWFHNEGCPGAGLWKNVDLKVVGKAKVREGGSNEAPSAPSDWLKLSFSYLKGLRNPTVEKFDVRDDICMKVGGFKHGQIMKVPNVPKSCVTIGVLRSDNGTLRLWFHHEDAQGAGLYEMDQLQNAEVIGTKIPQQITQIPRRDIPASTRPVVQCKRCVALERKIGLLEDLLGKSSQAEDDLRQRVTSLQMELRKSDSEVKKSQKVENDELKKLRKANERLRQSNHNLIKSTTTGWKDVEKMLMEPLERTEERLMKTKVQPEIDNLKLQQKKVEEEARAFEEKSREIDEQNRRNQTMLADVEKQEASTLLKIQASELETKRLRDELVEQGKQREQLRHETMRLQTELAQQVSEKKTLMLRLQEHSPASSLGEETWQFMDDSQDWTSYAASSSQELMEAYMSGKETYAFNLHGKRYEIDFKLMYQMNCRTEKRRKIRCHFSLPHHWRLSDEDALQSLRGAAQEAADNDDVMTQSAVSVATGISDCTRLAMIAPFKKHTRQITDQQELRKFAELLQNSLIGHNGTLCPEGCRHRSARFRVLEAYQVQNLYLWRRYQRFCQTMRDKQTQYGIIAEAVQPDVGTALCELGKNMHVRSERNERLLFHGTKHFKNAKFIAIEGFDNRIAQRGLYGQGTYFACQSCKSAQYGCPQGMQDLAKEGRRSKGTMIVSRVALGDPCYVTGTYNAARPPSKAQFLPSENSDDEDERMIPSDSVIARPGISRNAGQQLHMEFVTFAPEQAYPEVILRYVEE